MPAMRPILIVEDEPAIADLIEMTLEPLGQPLIKAHTGNEAANLLESTLFDLILLDVMLPGIDGIELLSRMRASDALRDIPVIMATAKGTEYDKIHGLDLGADYYLAKPFGVMELVSCVKAVLRRCRRDDAERAGLSAGGVSLDADARTVTAGGQRITLTYKEFELLRLFMAHPGTAFTREQLMERVWGTDYCGETRTVDMHIRTLRQKLGEYGEMIETVRGVGYRLEAQV